MGFSARKDTAVGNFLVEILSFKYIRNRCIYHFEIIIVSKSNTYKVRKKLATIFLAVFIFIFGLFNDENSSFLIEHQLVMMPIKPKVEQVMAIPPGGEGHPWSPGNKFKQSQNLRGTASSSITHTDQTHRRLFAPDVVRSRSSHSQRLQDNNPKPGKGPKVWKISTEDEQNNSVESFYHEDIFGRAEHAIARGDRMNPGNENNQTQEGSRQKFDETVQQSGLSNQHDQLSPIEQTIENRTRDRRAGDVSASEIDPKKGYSPKQTLKKGKSHLESDFGIDTSQMSNEEISQQMVQIAEDNLADPATEVYTNGTAQYQEDTVIALNKRTKIVSTYEDNPMYEKQHFISTYKTTDQGIREFESTLDGAILEERAVSDLGERPHLTVRQQIGTDGEVIHKTRGPNLGIDVQKNRNIRRMSRATQAPTQQSTLQDLDPSVRMTGKQIREVGEINQQLERNSSTVLTEKQQALVSRNQKRLEAIQNLESNQQINSTEPMEGEL